MHDQNTLKYYGKSGKYVKPMAHTHSSFLPIKNSHENKKTNKTETGIETLRSLFPISQSTRNRVGQQP